MSSSQCASALSVCAAQHELDRSLDPSQKRLLETLLLAAVLNTVRLGALLWLCRVAAGRRALVATAVVILCVLVACDTESKEGVVLVAVGLLDGLLLQAKDSLGARERPVATATTRWACEAGARHDLVTDLTRSRHVDCAREALEEVRDEGGGGPRLTGQLDR